MSAKNITTITHKIHTTKKRLEELRKRAEKKENELDYLIEAELREIRKRVISDKILSEGEWKVSLTCVNDDLVSLRLTSKIPTSMKELILNTYFYERRKNEDFNNSCSFYLNDYVSLTINPDEDVISIKLLSPSDTNVGQFLRRMEISTHLDPLARHLSKMERKTHDLRQILLDYYGSGRYGKNHS